MAISKAVKIGAVLSLVSIGVASAGMSIGSYDREIKTGIDLLSREVATLKGQSSNNADEITRLQGELADKQAIINSVAEKLGMTNTENLSASQLTSMIEVKLAQAKQDGISQGSSQATDDAYQKLNEIAFALGCDTDKDKIIQAIWNLQSEKDNIQNQLDSVNSQLSDYGRLLEEDRGQLEYLNQRLEELGLPKVDENNDSLK